MLLAHQGGWDEMLMVLVPIALLVGLLRVAKRRAERAAAERAGEATAAAAATTVPPGQTSPTDEAVSGDAQEIIVNVDDPAQIGQTFDVALGQTVVLRLLSDTDQEYHVHGYELEKKAAAGVEATFEFTADTAGSFEVESHTTDTVLATLQVA